MSRLCSAATSSMISSGTTSRHCASEYPSAWVHASASVASSPSEWSVVCHAQVLRLGQQVRRGTDNPVTVPGQQRLFGHCGQRVLEPGRVFLSAGCGEVGQVVAGDRDHQVVPLAHRHGVGRMELRDGHARIVRRAVSDQQLNYSEGCGRDVETGEVAPSQG
jgi:hypothetical protein